jgi:hypothetical protein
MNAQNGENEYYNGGEEEIDINKLNELEKAKFEKDFESIISYKESNEPKQKKEKLEEDNNLSASTSASGEDNPLTKFILLKAKIDQIEKEVQLYSENQELIDCNESIEDCFEKFKKLKESVNFISKSNNFEKLKKIIDSQKAKNDKNVENSKILRDAMCDNLHLHLINRANIINKLKLENPDQFSNIDYELYITPETKKIKKISKIMEIKNKLNNIKAKIGEWDLEKNKKNLISTVDELKMNIKLYDPDFKRELDKQKNIISKRVREMDLNEDFYKVIDKKYLDELFTGFKDGQEIENIINDTVTKMESLKEGHEISAYVGLKLQEMIQQQEKLGMEMNNNSQILINLKKNIKNNIEVMKKNIELLKAKINNKK